MFLRFKKIVWGVYMHVSASSYRNQKRVLNLSGVEGDSESPDMSAGSKISVLSKHNKGF